MGLLCIQEGLNKSNIISEFRSSGIWPLNPKTTTSKIGPSDALVDEVQDKQAKEEIFEKGIFLSKKAMIHYYGNERDLKNDQNDEEAMELVESLTIVFGRNNDINQFLKLLRGCKNHQRRKVLNP